jgi:hypothetical protein
MPFDFEFAPLSALTITGGKRAEKLAPRLKKTSRSQEHLLENDRPLGPLSSASKPAEKPASRVSTFVEQRDGGRASAWLQPARGFSPALAAKITPQANYPTPILHSSSGSN